MYEGDEWNAVSKRASKFKGNHFQLTYLPEFVSNFQTELEQLSETITSVEFNDSFMKVVQNGGGEHWMRAEMMCYEVAMMVE